MGSFSYAYHDADHGKTGCADYATERGGNEFRYYDKPAKHVKHGKHGKHAAPAPAPRSIEQDRAAALLAEVSDIARMMGRLRTYAGSGAVAKSFADALVQP